MALYILIRFGTRVLCEIFSPLFEVSLHYISFVGYFLVITQRTPSARSTKVADHTRMSREASCLSSMVRDYSPHFLFTSISERSDSLEDPHSLVGSSDLYLLGCIIAISSTSVFLIPMVVAIGGRLLLVLLMMLDANTICHTPGETWETGPVFAVLVVRIVGAVLVIAEDFRVCLLELV